MERYLSQQVAEAFSLETQWRGDRLFRGAVHVTESGANHVVADVRGSRLYLVSLTLDGADLAIDCTCPFYETLEPCKHIWGLLRFAESEGLLAAAKDLSLGLVDAHAIGQNGEGPDDEFYRYLSPPPPAWEQALDEMSPSTVATYGLPNLRWPTSRQIFYVLETPTAGPDLPRVKIVSRDRKLNGQLAVPREISILSGRIADLHDPLDREILAMLCGADTRIGRWSSWSNVPSSFRIPPLLGPVLFERLAGTGRFLLPDLRPVVLDQSATWEARITVQPAGGDWEVSASLARDHARISPGDLQLLAEGGWVLVGDRLSRLPEHYSLEILSTFRTRGSLPVAAEEIHRFLAELFVLPGLPELELPDELQIEETTAAPSPVFRIKSLGEYSRNYAGGLWFEYPGAEFAAVAPVEASYLADERKLVRRDPAAERQARAKLAELPLRELSSDARDPKTEWEISPKALPGVVWAMTSWGWRVEGQGSVYRQPADPHVTVTSGIDWFDVEGAVNFGPVKASLPELLQALQRGESTVTLSDGSIGLVPEEWKSRFGLLAATGKVEGEAVRFKQSQAMLLDALLAAQPAVSVDAAFGKIRERIRDFEGIEPAHQPAGFHGDLRDYQCEGLAWFRFLDNLGLGGCLADDMGVGKTIQVLALLEERRQRAVTAGERRPQSLVVAPKSVVFNWMREAARFTPELSVHEYAGTKRSLQDAAGADLLLTTYGTMRRDILKLQNASFDYAILDEAQNIKNPATATAKAARLLKAGHRLALTGTPVENHLGELWSIFEFLNPGMLGASSLWHSTSGAISELDERTRGVLHHALAPYILRRTKAQVAPELPERLEQTVYCEFEPAQRRTYDELRDHYRNALLGRIESVGLSRSKMQVLEALLRLRQVACHPALLDRERESSASAKFDALLPMLEEIIEEGHKALVFSQFTSLLALLKPKLKRRHWDFEYLDGKTRDREPRVDRFQTDPDCHLFLISLKAGGLGLNLTAADYVFLLDPWWNPAVEAQAIDRAHRIGQTRKVFAYRLIARDSVEEKVLELQESKRELAEAIITENNSFLRNIRPEDLQLLLS